MMMKLLKLLRLWPPFDTATAVDGQPEIIRVAAVSRRSPKVLAVARRNPQVAAVTGRTIRVSAKWGNEQ